MKAETKAVWAERVEEWRKSGKSAPEFAADKPYAGSTLQWAASRLKQAPARASTRRTRPRASVGGIRMAMAKVVRGRTQDAAVAEVVIEVAGTRIGVRRGFDGALLREVVIALSGGR
jgi:hypothetical protein